MIKLTQGLKHSLIVLEFLRNNEDLAHLNINVGTFTNCREVGLTFTLLSGTEDGQYMGCESFTWSVYEHRNSDSIIINGKPGYISLSGDLPYKGDKYDYIHEAPYNGHLEIADHLAKLILDHWNATKRVPVGQPK
jgi:hypothetical protein